MRAWSLAVMAGPRRAAGIGPRARAGGVKSQDMLLDSLRLLEQRVETIGYVKTSKLRDNIPQCFELSMLKLSWVRQEVMFRKLSEVRYGKW